MSEAIHSTVFKYTEAQLKILARLYLLNDRRLSTALEVALDSQIWPIGENPIRILELLERIQRVDRGEGDELSEQINEAIRMNL